MRKGNLAFKGYRSGADRAKQMLYPQLEDKLRNAGLALDGSTSENIINLCKLYLALLDEYRTELYKLPETLDLHSQSGSSSLLAADVRARRKAVRDAIEHTTRERRRTEQLLLSFTAISGYVAVEIFNGQKYEGRDDWQLSAGGVSAKDGTTIKKMTMQEAVETASLLRRAAHVAGNARPQEERVPNNSNGSLPSSTKVMEGSAG
jgi:hypothetical protein